MSKLEHELARRYRKNDETNEEEEVLIRPDEARKCDTLTDAYTGEPLYLRAENSELLRQHFVIKEKKLTENDKKIKEKISSETDDDRKHKNAQDFLKKAFNNNYNIKIYTKKCGKHHSKEPICFRDLLKKGCRITLECRVLDTHKRWDILITDPETGEIMLGIEVYNTHKTHETSRPSDVLWVEIDVKDIIDELRSAISESNFDTDSKIFEFRCMRSFIDNSEINKCSICIDEEAKIKNQKEQENREKEVQETMRQYKIRQDKETNDRNERERNEREWKNRQYKINQERESSEREEKNRQYKINQERERKEREERQERERKQWDDDEEKRKNIVTETNIKLKNAEKELRRIKIKEDQRLNALNNFWKKMKENKNNEDELKKLKEDQTLFNNLKIRLNNTKLELINEITQCKLVIEKNKLPKQRPTHYTFN
jgi:hypothetical protein